MATPPLTADQFRALLPAFADSSLYADETINVWLGIAINQLDANRWGDMLPMGLSLFAAHNLALERQNTLAASRGGAPGGTVGAISNKSIGSVSAGYDNASSAEQDGGNWNMTNYGTRWLYWARLVGAGGLQLTGNDGAIPLSSSFLGVIG